MVIVHVVIDLGSVQFVVVGVIGHYWSCVVDDVMSRLGHLYSFVSNTVTQ